MKHSLETKASLAEYIPHAHHLLTITLLKSSSQQTQKLYAEAYSNALNAVKLDTSAKYIEAKQAYQKVIDVSNLYDYLIQILIELYRISQSCLKVIKGLKFIDRYQT